jgi:hypothetical protein
MINLVAINNTMSSSSRCSPIRILQGYLKNRDIETTTYDFWFNDSDIEPNSFRKFGICQDMPRYNSIMRSLNGDLEGDKSDLSNVIVNLANTIEVNDNDIFGFSTTVISHYFFVLFALIVKKRNPKVKTVFGGYHISLGDKYSKFLLEKNIADFVVKYDGCLPLYNIYHNKATERYIVGPFVTDFWPMHDRIDITLSNNTLSTLTSYGCNNNCYFCASDRKFVDCNLKKFEEYLDLMISRGVKYVELNDDNVNITSDRFSKVANIMKRCKVEDWMSFVNPVHMIEDIPKDSNLKRVLFGSDSFNDDVLKLINKKQTVEQTLKSLDIYMKNDVEAYCSRICGLPGDTDEVFEKDLKIMIGLRKKYGDKLTIWPTSFRVFPGSYMYNHPEEFGITFSYFPGTDIQSEFFIDDLSREIVDKRLERIRKEIPEKPIAHHKSNFKNRFIKRS